MGQSLKNTIKVVFFVVFVLAIVLSIIIISCNKYGNSLDEDYELSDYTKIISVDELKTIETNGKYILAADIDLSGEEWTPIADFKGVIDGQGHEIRNMTITQSDEKNVGFVRSLTGTLRNFNLIDVNIDVSAVESNVGGVVGYLKSGKVENICVSGSVKASRSASCGGIFGYVSGGSFSKVSVKNIEVVGKTNVGGSFGKLDGVTINGGDGTPSETVIVRGETNVGGKAGYVKSSGDMSNLKTAAEVSGQSCVGGIFGYCYCYDDLTLSSFSNEGNVTGSENCTGGIIGEIEIYTYAKVDMDNFNNTGDVSGNGYVGGLFGYCKGTVDSTFNPRTPTVTNSKSSGVITGTWCVGGISGYAEELTIKKCYNEGSEITASGYKLEDGEKRVYLGGYIGNAKYVNLIDCTNSVNLTAAGDYYYVGGIAGCITKARKDMSDLKNTGEISGGSGVGGVFGYCYCYDDLTLSSFSNEGKVTGSENYTGGIMGKVEMYTYADVEIDNVNNTADVTGNEYVGGLFGYCKNDFDSTRCISTLTNSKSSGVITGTWCIGGISGYVKGLTIKKCYNEGSEIMASGYKLEDGEKRVYLGGYVGNGDSVSFSECTNDVNLSTAEDYYYVGGIAGYIKNARKDMSDLKNTGDIEGGACVGGIFGYCYYYESSTLTSFSNEGNVTGFVNCTGGIMGKSEIYTYAKMDMDNFNNTGEVSGNGYVGDLFGYFSSSSKTSRLFSYSANGNVCGYSKNLEIIG